MIPKQMYGWNVKDVTRNKVRQIELRKSFPNAQILAIVSAKKGFTFGYDKPIPTPWGHSNKGFDIRLSMNGPALLQFDDLEDLYRAAKAALINLEGQK